MGRKLTIGVGRNLDDLGISEDESDYLLASDIDRTCDDLDAHLPWWRGLSEKRQRALANMAFNLGVSRLLQFVNMLSAMQRGDFHTATAEALSSKWAGKMPSCVLWS